MQLDVALQDERSGANLLQLQSVVCQLRILNIWLIDLINVVGTV